MLFLSPINIKLKFKMTYEEFVPDEYAKHSIINVLKKTKRFLDNGGFGDFPPNKEVQEGLLALDPKLVYKYKESFCGCWSVLCDAAQNDCLPIIRLKVESLKSPHNLETESENKSGKNTFHVSDLIGRAVYGGPSVVRYLKPYIKNINKTDAASNFTPLHWAAQAGETEVVRALLEYPDIDLEVLGFNNSNVKEISPLARAIYSGKNGVAYLLLENGAKLNEDMIYYACKSSSSFMLEKVFSYWSDFNFTFKKHGATPLQVAIEANREYATWKILTASPDVSIESRKKYKKVKGGHTAIDFVNLALEKAKGRSTEVPEHAQWLFKAKKKIEELS